MEKSMMKAKNLRNEYWTEVFACSIYILNRSPTKSVKDKTPLEAWSGVKLDVENLRVFGSVAYTHVPDELRKNINDRSEKYIFVG